MNIKIPLNILFHHPGTNPMNDQNSQRNSKWIEPREWFYSSLPPAFPFPTLNVNEISGNTNFIRDLHPFGAEYYQKLIPAFSSFFLPSTQFSDYTSLFLRDGAINLIDFIIQYEKELKDISTSFFVHRKLAPLIPSDLQDSFFFYDYSYSPLKEIPKKRLIISGSFFNEQLTESFVIQQLQKIKANLDKDTTIETFFSTGNATQNTKSIYQTYKAIESELGPITNHLEWKQVYYQRFLPESFVDSYYFELNPHLYYSDSFVTHYFLKKGAQPLMPSEKTKESFSLPLSPWHSFKLWDKLPETSGHFDKLKPHWEILKMLRQNKDERPFLGVPSLKYPWNSDFCLYLQEMLTEEKILETDK
mgnify:CR=1 FL=1